MGLFESGMYLQYSQFKGKKQNIWYTRGFWDALFSDKLYQKRSAEDQSLVNILIFNTQLCRISSTNTFSSDLTKSKKRTFSKDLKIHCRRSTGFSQGSSSSLLLAPCGVDGVSSGGFARFAAEPERLRRFLREVLEVVEKVEGEQKGDHWLSFNGSKIDIFHGEITIFDGEITIFDGWIAILLVKSRFSLVDVQILRWTPLNRFSGHENYHLRLTAGSAPPSDLAAQNPEEMEKLIQRAGFSNQSSKALLVDDEPLGISGLQDFTMILWMGF